MKLKYFTLDECFAYCSDAEIHTALGNLSITNNILSSVERLEALRAFLGVSVRINSGYRDPKHNKIAGGSSSSHHMRGTAYDLHLDFDWSLFQSWMKSNVDILYQVIRYDNFVHVDFLQEGETRSSYFFIDKRS